MKERKEGKERTKKRGAREGRERKKEREGRREGRKKEERERKKKEYFHSFNFKINLHFNKLRNFNATVEYSFSGLPFCP